MNCWRPNGDFEEPRCPSGRPDRLKSALRQGRSFEHETDVLKVELHTHTADDPHDRIPYSTTQLIDRATALGYDALAITLHDKQLALDPYRAYAERRGLVLIPG